MTSQQLLLAVIWQPRRLTVSASFSKSFPNYLLDRSGTILGSHGPAQDSHTT